MKKEIKIVLSGTFDGSKTCLRQVPKELAIAKLIKKIIKKSRKTKS